MAELQQQAARPAGYDQVRAQLVAEIKDELRQQMGGAQNGRSRGWTPADKQRLKQQVIADLRQELGLNTAGRSSANVGTSNQDWLGKTMTAAQSEKGQGFLWGAASVLVAMALFPGLREGVGPQMESLNEVFHSLSGKINKWLAERQTEIEDMVAEKQFQQLAQEIDDDLLDYQASEVDDEDDE